MKQNLDSPIFYDLKRISELTPENCKKQLTDFLTYYKPKAFRTEDQHRGLFLWFSLIAEEAERQGITWDMIIRHTHQLKITKDGLHEMCKQLQKVLWGTKSTKHLQKHEHIDQVIDHFTALFAKEGMELPPFPFDEDKQKLYSK